MAVSKDKESPITYLVMGFIHNDEGYVINKCILAATSNKTNAEKFATLYEEFVEFRASKLNKNLFTRDDLELFSEKFGEMKFAFLESYSFHFFDETDSVYVEEVISI